MATRRRQSEELFSDATGSHPPSQQSSKRRLECFGAYGAVIIVGENRTAEMSKLEES